jgi:MFS family permease
MTMQAAARTPVGRARWTRLVPLAIVVYIISFMDRTNIGFAFDGIGHDLHVSSTGEGLAGGIFFIGYLFLQIPGGHLAEHWSAKKFVGIMICVWGVFAVLSGFVTSFGQLLVVRFFLGVAEGGIWPAILVMLAHWFPERERARAYGYWIMNIAIASIITAPLSGWLLSIGDWRLLFIVEGVVPFVIAAPLWFAFAADRPSDAKWCSPEEREYIETSLAAEQAGDPERGRLRDIVKSSIVWKLVVVYFLIQVGFYGLNLWLPHEVKDITGGSSVLVGFVTAIPYVCAIVALWFNAQAADRDGRYRLHVFVPLSVAAVALVLSVSTGSIAALSVGLLSVAMAGALAYDGPFWASASRVMPAALAGGAMGLINAIGNLGGFVGPYVGGFLQDRSGGSFLTTSVVLAIALLAAGLVMWTVGPRGDRAAVVDLREPAADRAATDERVGSGRSRLHR